MSLLNRLLAVFEAFCHADGRSPSRLSTIIFNDGKAVGRLRSGGDITTGTYERAMQWLSDHWPEGAAWPADVPRPDLSPSGGDTSLPPAPAAAASLKHASESFLSSHDEAA